MFKNFLLIFSIIFICGSSNSEIVSEKKSGFELLDTEFYYYGEIEDELYFFKFENVNNSIGEGYFFKTGNNLYTDKQDFRIEKKSKNINFIVGENKYVLKSDLNFSSDSIYGSYAVKEKFLLFFKKFKWKDKINLKKYSEPEFKRFPDLYRSKVFDDIIIKNDIIYGNAKGYWNSYVPENDSYFSIIKKGISSSIRKKDLPLKMDVYMPSGDTSRNRPFIMFVHGGGFYIGDKQDEPMVEMCKYFSSLGYVTASINYRLGFKPNGTALERAGYRGVQDAHAAMRYIVENRDYFGIDTSRLFAAGSSAGAITVLNLAYMRNKNKPECAKGNFIVSDMGDIDVACNNINTSFSIKAIANMWGAVNDLCILENSNTSVISFHSEGDKVVPIDCNYPFRDIKGNITSYILNKVYGSDYIHSKAKELGLREKLCKYKGNKHTIYKDESENLNSNFYIIEKDISNFFYEEMVSEICEIQSVPKVAYNRAAKKYNSTCSGFSEIYWKIEGGIILDSYDNFVEVIWFRDKPEYKLILSGCFDNGASFYDEYIFKIASI